MKMIILVLALMFSSKLITPSYATEFKSKSIPSETQKCECGEDEDGECKPCPDGE